jgi:hypothetical protein
MAMPQDVGGAPDIQDSTKTVKYSGNISFATSHKHSMAALRSLFIGVIPLKV